MLGAIVLRDIPKKEVSIDMFRQEIQGGFRGFNLVPPAAWHYVSVLSGQHHTGFWCYLKPQQAVVMVFDSLNNRFEEADPESQAQYSQMALSGSMGPALRPYPHDHFGAWYGLVRHIPEAGFPPQLGEEPADSDFTARSRFDRALFDTHGGEPDSFLAEFQFAFVRWVVSLNTAEVDEGAFERWRHLLLSVYNAGENRMRQSADLFARLVETLLRQFNLLPDSWFTADSFLAGSQAGYLSEDMIDSEIPDLVEKGQALAEYLRKRR